KPRPNSLSRKAQRKIQPIDNRTAARTPRAADEAATGRGPVGAWSPRAGGGIVRTSVAFSDIALTLSWGAGGGGSSQRRRPRGRQGLRYGGAARKVIGA